MKLFKDDTRENLLIDKPFLLSVDEYKQYVGSRSDIIHNNCWWLRSPGFYSSFAPTVLTDSRVIVNGHYVHTDSVGVRPAIWIKKRQPKMCPVCLEVELLYGENFCSKECEEIFYMYHKKTGNIVASSDIATLNLLVRLNKLPAKDRIKYVAVLETLLKEEES